MRQASLAAAALILSAVPTYAQSTNGSSQPSGGNESIIRTPPSSNGASNGNSGNIGAPTSTYPAPLRDLNNPSVTYGNNGRFVNPNVGGGVRRR
ncbi:MAG: hypothetical protein JSR99_16155 [Proteobacteria bacterium]|nr:hypothetical protein [Pseudomonadota bacterium]